MSLSGTHSSHNTRSRTRARGRNPDTNEIPQTVPGLGIIPPIIDDDEVEVIDVVGVVDGDVARVYEHLVNPDPSRDIDNDVDVIVDVVEEPVVVPPSPQSRFSLSSLASLMFSQGFGRHGDLSSSNSGNSNSSSDHDNDDVLYVGASPDRRSSSPEEVEVVDLDDISELSPIIPNIQSQRGGWMQASQPDNLTASPLPPNSNNSASSLSGAGLNAERNNVNSPGTSSRDRAQDHEGDDEESCSPPQKIPRLDTSVRSDNDEEGFNCQICYEPFTNSGNHRVCCLKCGHIYGKDCIERWVHTSKRCPSCNSKATKRDIRILYVKNIKAADTAELERLKQEVDRVNIEKNKVELRNSVLRNKEEVQAREIRQLKLEIARFNHRQPEIIDIAAEAGPSSGAPTVSKLHNQACSSKSGYLRMPKLDLIKHFDIKEGQSRVGVCSDWMNLLVVSHSITSRLFPGGSFGIRKFNTLDMKPYQSFPIHQKALRDMSFCSSQADLLLTVGLDKKAVLFNCNSNCPVQTFVTPSALWSCCWNEVNQNIFYVGSVHGLVTSYDIRAPQEPLGNLTIPTIEKSAVQRLRFVPPSYQSQSFNMSGLLIQKVNSVWFAEMLGGVTTDEPRYHQLPLEGPFVNADFEKESRHVLVSSRPKVGGPVKVGTNHVICNLGKTYSTAEERDVFSCDVIQSFHGGFQESSILCRSTIFSPQQGQVYVAANGEGVKTVRVWDISNAEQKTMIRINQDAALDFVHGKVNETRFLGIVTEKSTSVYGVK